MPNLPNLEGLVLLIKFGVGGSKLLQGVVQVILHMLHLLLQLPDLQLINQVTKY